MLPLFLCEGLVCILGSLRIRLRLPKLELFIFACDDLSGASVGRLVVNFITVLLLVLDVVVEILVDNLLTETLELSFSFCCSFTGFDDITFDDDDDDDDDFASESSFFITDLL